MNSITKTMKVFFAIALFIIASFHAIAQDNAGKDPIQELFFSPELVMRYQNEIRLKKEQKEIIISNMEEAQKKFNRLQWDLQAEMTDFQKLLAEPTISEASALAQLDKVLDQERLIKKAQISLMIKIKNTLTDEQKAKLNTFKEK